MLPPRTFGSGLSRAFLNMGRELWDGRDVLPPWCFFPPEGPQLSTLQVGRGSRRPFCVQAWRCRLFVGLDGGGAAMSCL